MTRAEKLAQRGDYEFPLDLHIKTIEDALTVLRMHAYDVWEDEGDTNTVVYQMKKVKQQLLKKKERRTQV
jgi:hypothetical protein